MKMPANTYLRRIADLELRVRELEEALISIAAQDQAKGRARPILEWCASRAREALGQDG
jgi:hypothetical protein